MSQTVWFWYENQSKSVIYSSDDAENGLNDSSLVILLYNQKKGWPEIVCGQYSRAHVNLLRLPVDDIPGLM